MGTIGGPSTEPVFQQRGGEDASKVFSGLSSVHLANVVVTRAR